MIFISRQPATKQNLKKSLLSPSCIGNRRIDDIKVGDFSHIYIAADKISSVAQIVASAMATSGVKLYGGRPSPYVNRVVMALEMKSVDYELVEMNPYEKSELLIKINPIHKKIPVLVHGDRPICESLIIVQYIDDAWTNGPSILPTDPYDRATARFWAAFIDDNVQFSSSLLAP